MSVLPVLENPNPELRIKSHAVERAEIVSVASMQLVEDLIQTMNQENGVGIAAPQVGIPKRLIIVETEHGPEAFFNPKIYFRSFRKIKSEEGCLSVPGVFGIVQRHKCVKVIAYNHNGDKIKIKTSGFLATVFQHEIDHLDGILFIDKVMRFTSPKKM